MKALTLLFSGALAASILAQDTQPAPDPTKASAKMKASLMAGGSSVPDLKVKGLVLSGEQLSAILLLETADNVRVLARPGVPFTVLADGEARRLVVKRIAENGIEIEAPDQKETVMLGSLSVVSSQRARLPGDVDYVEFRDLPLIEALRMLSDQTQQNYSASVEANKIQVNAMLRGVSANSVVEEICKSHGLWFRRDPVSGITRIMTVGEFEKDLAGYREERTEVFTLKFPNVTDVAIAIGDLYGDRVQLSLGSEESDDQVQRDIEGRFDRFDIVNERTQSTGSLNQTVLGNNVNGFVGEGGRFSSIGSGSEGRSGSSSRSRSDFRRDRRTDQAASADEGAFRGLTSEQAERVDEARADGRNVEALRKRPATIFVTASRRNNMVVVRTADMNALEDIRKLVTRLDVQTPMVLMEVKVLSIELGKGFDSAFEYQAFDGQFGASFTTGAINPSITRDPITNRPVGLSPLAGENSTGVRDGQFVFTYLGESVRARIQLLASKNRVKTVATPTLLTANNEVSRIFLGEELPLVRGINSQTILTDNNAATTSNTQTVFRNVGNTLLITPNINADRTVTLRLVQENSFIKPNGGKIPVVTTSEEDTNGILPGLGNGNRRNETGVRQVPIDIVSSRTVSGTFVAKDGMSVAIGGLIEEVDSDRREGVPILGDIPGLGLLFRRQSTEKSRRELVVILRPYVLNTAADGERISRDLVDRLAPVSVEKLVDEGFLPDLPPPPKAKPVRRPAPSAAASKRGAATPLEICPPKKAETAKKSSLSK